MSEVGPNGPTEPPDPGTPASGGSSSNPPSSMITTNASSTTNANANSQASLPGGPAGPQERGYSFAANPANTRTKWIQIPMFKTERSAKLQMSEEEHAKIIQRLNIDPRRLHSIDDHEKITLHVEIDESVDLSTINLHEAIPVRKGLRTRPIRQHARLEFVKVYKTAAKDSDTDIAAMFTDFGEVISIVRQTYQPKRDSSNALKALVNVKKGDRDVTIKLHSYLPSFGILTTSDGTVRKVKFTRQNQVKTCVRCGRREKPLDDEDMLTPCPGEGNVDRCKLEDPEYNPSQEEIWNFWKEQARLLRGQGSSGQQVYANITADTIEVFNIHVEATREQLKTWLDSKGIGISLENILNDQNPRKKKLVKLSKENVLKCLEVHGHWMQYPDGTKSRLYLEAIREDEESPAPPPDHGSPPPPPPPNDNQPPPPNDNQLPPRTSSQIPPITSQTSSTTSSYTAPTTSPLSTTHTTTSSSRPISSTPQINHSPQQNQQSPTLHEESPLQTSSSSGIPTSSTPTSKDTTSSTDQRPPQVDLFQQWQDALRDIQLPPSEAEQNVLDQIKMAAEILYPESTSTARDPLAIPHVIPQNISGIQEPNNNPLDDPMDESPDILDQPTNLLHDEENDEDEERYGPVCPDAFIFQDDSSMEDVTMKTASNVVPATTTDDLPETVSRMSDYKEPDSLSRTASNLLLSCIENSSSSLALAEEADNPIDDTVNLTNTNSTSSDPMEVIAKIIPEVLDDSSSGPPPIPGLPLIDQPGVRIKPPRAESESSSSMRPNTPTSGAETPCNLSGTSPFPSDTSPTRHSASSEEENAPFQFPPEFGASPDSQDSGLSKSQGSSSDSPSSSSSSRNVPPPSPGTIEPQPGISPGHKGKIPLLAVETSPAGDNNIILNSTFKSDTNDTNENDAEKDPLKLDDTITDDDDVNMSDISETETTLSNTTVIENLPDEETKNRLAIENYLLNKNSADWPKYLEVIDLQRRGWELSKKLANPELADQIDMERKKNEELQRKYNPDGSKFGMIWCGPLSPRPRRRSTGSEPGEATVEPEVRAKDDSYTPAASTNKRNAHFSSSPEEDSPVSRNRGGRKSAKKKRKGSTFPGDEPVQVKNFYAVLGDIMDKEEDEDQQQEEENVTQEPSKNPLQISDEVITLDSDQDTPEKGDGSQEKPDEVQENSEEDIQLIEPEDQTSKHCD